VYFVSFVVDFLMPFLHGFFVFNDPKYG